MNVRILPKPGKALWNMNRMLSLILFAIIFSTNAFGQISVSAGTAPVTIPAGGFEIDGDLLRATAGDWLGTSATNSVLTGTGAPRNPDSTYHLVDLFTSGDTVFVGGMKKNTNLNAWGWKEGNPSPAKCDINHLLLHISKAANGHIWITLSGDRESVNGNSFISLSLHQKAVVLEDTDNDGDGFFKSAAPSSTGGRTVGDVSISAEFTGGGTNPNLYLEEWKQVGGAYQWAGITLPAGSPTVAYGKTNATAITGVPYSTFTSNPGTYQINSFIEVSFDITEIYKNVSVGCVGAIESMLILTKSSQSVTADLADFITPVQVNLDITVAAPTAPDKAFCVNAPSLDSIIATGASGASFKWYTTSTGGVLSGLFDNNATLNTDQAVDQSTIQTATFYVTQSLDGCESDPDTVVVQISAGPTAPSISTVNPTCSTKNGSITVTSPVGAPGAFSYIYNGISYPDSVGPYEFEAGAGYSIQVDSAGCVSAADECEAEPAQIASNSTIETTETRAVIGSKTKVKAAPNPFDDRVRFTMESYVSGHGSLEIYNTLGQKISTVYQGHIEAGRSLVREFTVPRTQRAALVYVFRVGNERVTGKLIGR
jgi:hypothetical protein